LETRDDAGQVPRIMIPLNRKERVQFGGPAPTFLNPG